MTGTKPSIVQELALSSGNNHTKEEISLVLDAFIDPENKKMHLKNYFENLLSFATSDGIDNEEIKRIKSIMWSVFDEVKDARIFNPSYLGHMLSESCIPGLLGYLLALRIGSNTVAREVSIFESKLEPEAIKGLLHVIGFDLENGSGTFTSGGTLAMMTALTVARKIMEESLHNRKRWLLRNEFYVLASPFAHYSIEKNVNILAGPKNEIKLIKVEPDPENFVMSTTDLEKKIQKYHKENIMAIIAIAGETETGLVDDLATISKIAEKNDIKLIVDGAYGGPYKLSKKVSHLYNGIEKAFAVTIDPHKALYTPYSNGAVLFSSLEDHAMLAYGIKATYLGFSEEKAEIINNLRTNTGNLGQKRIEGSMGAGPILSTLAVLRTLGESGLGIIYDLSIDRVQHLYEKVNKYPDILFPLYKPQLNLLCFSLSIGAREKLHLFSDDDLKAYVNRIKDLLDNSIVREGGYYFSTTELPLSLKESLWVWRACIMNPRTTNKIVDDAIENLVSIVRKDILTFQAKNR